VRALFYFYAFFFFLFNYLKRERVKRGRNGAEGKRGASEEKTGSVEDGVFSRINDLAAKRAEILGFLDMPVPTWKTARRAPAGRSIAGFPAAVDELAEHRGARRRATRPARDARSSIESGGRPSLLGRPVDAGA
jgi:hypothetical protein